MAQHQLLHHPYPVHHHHHQLGGSNSDSQSLDSIIASSKPAAAAAAEDQLPQPLQDKKPRPPDSEAQKCPRCDSTNTKFCYYNNYSLSQPRYFCKSCRRYWTKGGTLRNVPVGGGCRKSSSSSSSSAAAKRPSSPSFSSSFKRAHNHDVTAMTPSPLLSSLHHQLSSSYAAHGGLGLVLASESMIANPNGVAFLNSLNNAGSGLFQNLCYGVSEDNMGAHLPFEESAAATSTTTTMKQEAGIMAMGGNESKGTWGVPWQAINYGEVGSTAGVAAAAAGGGDHLEPIRGGYWNGLMSNSAGWHGLLNSTPLQL